MTKNNKSIPTFHPIASQPDNRDRDILSNLSDVSNDLKDNISIRKPNTNTAMLVLRQSVYLRAQLTLDYQKINHGQVANVKSHPLVLYKSPYSRPSQSFF